MVNATDTTTEVLGGLSMFKTILIPLAIIVTLIILLGIVKWFMNMNAKAKDTSSMINLIKNRPN